MTNLSDTLAALSEAATQGEWEYRGWPSPNTIYQGSRRDISAVAVCVSGGTRTDEEGAANAAFIVALVNAYRSGQLVPVPSVERVSKAVHEALCRVDVIRYLDLPPQTAENVAMIVIAAMQEGRE